MPNYYGALFTQTIHPFGMGGAINTTGDIFGASVSTAGSTSFIEVENILVDLPVHAMVKEVELGLTIGLSIATTTASPKVTYNIKDLAQSSYDTLVAFTSTTLLSLALSTPLTDFDCVGRRTPSDGTYFTGKGSFNVQATIASNADTVKAQGAMKQESYVTCKYYLTA